MADLLIRDIDPELKRQIEARASAHRQSLSEEAKSLLRKALAEAAAPRRLGTEMAGLIPEEHRLEDLDFEIHDPVAPPPDLS